MSRRGRRTGARSGLGGRCRTAVNGLADRVLAPCELRDGGNSRSTSRVGSVRAHEYHLRAHRIAVWRQLPDVPDDALLPMLRHELQHAARWERSGTVFFEADEELRALVAVDRTAYARLPTEREANAVSSRTRRHRPQIKYVRLQRSPTIANWSPKMSVLSTLSPKLWRSCAHAKSGDPSGVRPRKSSTWCASRSRPRSGRQAAGVLCR